MEKFKVLMVDDETDITNFFTKAFENFPQVEFFTANRARLGIDIAKEQHPHVVLLDLKMPGMNGEEALDEIHSLLPDARFIVMTGWEDGQTQARIEAKSNVAAFYPKPIDLEKVIAKVMSLIMVKE